MKNIFKSFVIAGALLSISSCSDYLDTMPTTMAPDQKLFESAENAMVAMNGIYRSTYVSGWSKGNEHQNFGIQSSTMLSELMGDDFVQAEQGNGWFYFDYIYNSRTRWTSAAWRSYAQWNFYYTLIANCNYIIANDGKIPGEDQTLARSVAAQAYSMRAYCYFQLVQQFAQTLVGHEDWKGVPLMTEPTSTATQGKPRAKVSEVYALINSDIEKALSLFEANKDAQSQKVPAQDHVSHIDWYVTNAFKAQVALVENDWNKAFDAINKALQRTGKKVLSKDEIMNGFNDVGLADVMWGANIVADQSTVYASFFSHMDSFDKDKYAAKSRKCVSSWLYNQIPSVDARKGWWKGKLAEDAPSGPNMSYNQLKFKFKNMKTNEGDYIYLRWEELLLIKAEAACKKGDYENAIKSVLDIVKNRRTDIADYTTYINGLVKSGDLTFATTGTVSTLMDEIAIQRRIELWGEGRRLYDILRWKTGFNRNFPETNHSNVLSNINTMKPDAPQFIMTIPQAEFDGNTALNVATDQNPLN